MKHYNVTTRFGLEPITLFTTGKEFFSSENLEEARMVYEAEVKEVSERYTNIKNLNYNPTDDEINHGGIIVSLSWEDPDKWGEPGGADTIEISDYYFDE